MSEKPLIVLVEDDAVISELIQYNLTNEGYDIRAFRNGMSMFDALPGFDRVFLFILDLMLPGMDGFEICKSIRENPKYQLVPVVILTARGTESDKVKGLEAGADDYITKPFGIREFLARVQAHIRRYSKAVELREGPDTGKGTAAAAGTSSDQGASGDTLHISDVRTMEYAGVMLDDVRHRVFSGGKEIEMTNREYELLKFLMQNRGIAFSRDDLLNHVWGYEYTGETRTVDVHIRQLRRKIEKDDANPVIIETVRGRGYRFCEK